jgi:hypothetical protein
LKSEHPTLVSYCLLSLGEDYGWFWRPATRNLGKDCRKESLRSKCEAVIQMNSEMKIRPFKVVAIPSAFGGGLGGATTFGGQVREIASSTGSTSPTKGADKMAEPGKKFRKSETGNELACLAALLPQPRCMWRTV